MVKRGHNVSSSGSTRRVTGQDGRTLTPLVNSFVVFGYYERFRPRKRHVSRSPLVDGGCDPKTHSRVVRRRVFMDGSSGYHDGSTQASLERVVGVEVR